MLKLIINDIDEKRAEVARYCGEHRASEGEPCKCPVYGDFCFGNPDFPDTGDSMIALVYGVFEADKKSRSRV